jgi:hypothetical protein
MSSGIVTANNTKVFAIELDVKRLRRPYAGAGASRLAVRGGGRGYRGGVVLWSVGVLVAGAR